MSGIANPLQRENVKHAKLEFNDMWLLTDKVLVGDSGLMDGFRDCHCHLLPGVDDGVGTVDETLEILRLWEKAGTPYLNFLCKVLWCQTFMPSQAPTLPPMMANSSKAASRMRHFAFLAFHLSKPYVKNVATLMIPR